MRRHVWHSRECHAPLQNVATMNRECLNTEREIDLVPDSPKSNVEVWQQVLAEVKLPLTRSTFDTWVKRTTAQRVDGRWEVTCANALAKDWLEQGLATTLRRTLVGVLGEAVGEIEFRAKSENRP